MTRLQALAEDVLIELGHPDWNDPRQNRKVARFIRANGFDQDSSVIEIVDQITGDKVIQRNL